jgi:hypothetical protein
MRSLEVTVYEALHEGIAYGYDENYILGDITQIPTERVIEDIEELSEFCTRLGAILVSPSERDTTLQSLLEYDPILQTRIKDPDTFIGPCPILDKDGMPYRNGIGIWKIDARTESAEL